MRPPQWTPNKMKCTSSPGVHSIGNVPADASPPGKLLVSPSTSVVVSGMRGISGVGGIDGTIGDGSRIEMDPGVVTRGVAD